MKFYKRQHAYYCGIDPHVRTMYLCIIDSEGQVVIHKNMNNTARDLTKTIKPFQHDMVIAVECMFIWYWIADFCEDNHITFVLGHALYMKAIHCGKGKVLSILAHKIGRAVYFILKRKGPFNGDLFLAA